MSPLGKRSHPAPQRAPYWLWLGAFVALLLSACAGERDADKTRLALTVQAEPEVQSVTAWLRLRARPVGAEAAAPLTIRVGANLMQRAGSMPESSWPVLVELRPPTQDFAGEVDIEVEALDQARQVLLRSGGRTRFVLGREKQVELTLRDACLSATDECSVDIEEQGNGSRMPVPTLDSDARSPDPTPDATLAGSDGSDAKAPQELEEAGPGEAGPASALDGATPLDADAAAEAEAGSRADAAPDADATPDRVIACVGAGKGTRQEPCLLSSCADLRSMDVERAAHYALDRDIHCEEYSGDEGFGFTPIEPFSGSLDGRGHHIVGLRIWLPRYYHTGLFSNLKGAYIHDLTLDHVAMLAWEMAAPLAGEADAASRIERVHTSGTLVSNLANVGPIVGGDVVVAQIVDSSSDVLITTEQDAVDHKALPDTVSTPDTTRDANWDGVYAFRAGGTRCAGVLITRRALLVPDDCVCAANAGDVQVLDANDGVIALGSNLLRPADRALNVALVALDRELRLGRPVQLARSSAAALAGSTLRCDSLGTARTAGGYVELSTLNVTASLGASSSTPAMACGQAAAAPELMLSAAAGPPGTPCFHDAGGQRQLAGVITRSAAGVVGLRSADALRAWLAGSAGLMSEAVCARQLIDELTFEPDVVFGFPKPDQVLVAAIAPWTDLTMQRWIYAPNLRADSWRSRDGLGTGTRSNEIRLAASRVVSDGTPKLTAILMSESRRPTFYSWLVDPDRFSDWTDGVNLEVHLRPAMRGAYAALLHKPTGSGVNGQLVIWKPAPVRFSPAILPAPAIAIHPFKQPTLVGLDADDTQLVVGYRKPDAGFATRDVGAQCESACAVKDVNDKCSALCSDETSWDLPRDLDHIELGFANGRLLAVSSDTDGSLRVWQLDAATGHATDYGYLGARAFGTFTIAVEAGQPYVVYSARNAHPHRRPLAGCLASD